MNPAKKFKALGLMSGTSMDGIDVAYLESDGTALQYLGAHRTEPYNDVFRDRLRGLIAGDNSRQDVEEELTRLHADAVERYLADEGLSSDQIDVIGFHGHTIAHDPAAAMTDQIGDGRLLSALLGVPVVNDLRSNDVAHGGEGAPLAPVYHAAMLQSEERPVVVLNLGGVANVTWIGEQKDDLIAFDTGPGNALIDDWVFAHGAGRFDDGGRIAAKGKVDLRVLDQLLSQEYFREPPPKSLDRDDFNTEPVQGLGLEDGAATLTAFTIQTVKLAEEHLPGPAARWIVCGGGRHNEQLMQGLAHTFDDAKVLSADALGWNGDAVEAQAFAYMAIRSELGLPISFPGTTGVKEALTGGVLNLPSATEP